MTRPLSKLAPEWWDYTTLESDLLKDAAGLTPAALGGLARPGFDVRFYDTVEEFYAAEALEYIEVWRQASPDNPAGVCGPIGPTEHLPLVARMVNAMELNLRHAHFWGMDEWADERGEAVSASHPLSFERCDRELCFDRIDPDLAMPEENLHFPGGNPAKFRALFDQVPCRLMQGGQGEIKHWAFNDPPRRKGAYLDAPPSPEEYRRLGTRHVELHPVTKIQNARTSGGGNITLVPDSAITVGPVETWKSERVSIWHPGRHDNPFGMRLSALMISKRIVDTSVPISLLADHPNVCFHYLRAGMGDVSIEMH